MLLDFILFDGFLFSIMSWSHHSLLWFAYRKRGNCAVQIGLFPIGNNSREVQMI